MGTRVCSGCGSLEGIEEYDKKLWEIYDDQHPPCEERFLYPPGEAPGDPLVFTSDDFYEMGGDEEAYEIMNLAMERDMVDRDLCPVCGRPDPRYFRQEVLEDVSGED